MGSALYAMGDRQVPSGSSQRVHGICSESLANQRSRGYVVATGARVDLAQELVAILLGYTLHQDFLLRVLVPQFAIDEQILRTTTHQAFVLCPIGVTATIC